VTEPGAGAGGPGQGRAPDPGDGDLDDLAGDLGASARRVSGAIAGTTFVVLHAIVGYLTLSLGLVAPAWAVTVLSMVWLVVAVVGWRWRRRRPILTMLAPFATAALAIAVVSLGDAYLGWTA
jgi:hypothetical protein